MPKFSRNEYIFTCSTLITLGKPTDLPYGLVLRGNSDRSLFPRLVIVNTPCPNLLFVNEIRIGNHLISTDNGLFDTVAWWNGGKGVKVNWPIINPGDTLLISAHYTGYVPPGYYVNGPFTTSFSIVGPEVQR